MGDLQEPNVFSLEQEPTNPSISDISVRSWAVAHTTANNIISHLRPTILEDRKRIQIINFIRSLIKRLCHVEVLPYGSVPLRTYLPDGDIDLTTFVGAIVEEGLAADIVSELQKEERDSHADFLVKEIRLINAEVKLVKCLVENIVVDISFNQIGGLCALCFLEQVDRSIGKDNLFKRSILLIKAWCYYESRILGAHHGLISTYALEILVLFIFQIFHLTLDGPLAVLYKFLDYYSKFDWKNYGITLLGPVRLSSLPEFETELPENVGGGLLLSEDFYRLCEEKFSVPLKGVGMQTGSFLEKHINIVDPLKDFNNLGRSVSEGNFYRIKSAFTFGARKLGHILMQSEDSIAAELCTFFSNTLDRHGDRPRPDVQNEAIHSSSPSPHPATSILDSGSNPEDQDGVCISTALDTGMDFRTLNEKQTGSTHLSTDVDGSVTGCDVPNLNCHLSRDAEDDAISGVQCLQILDESQNNSSTCKEKPDLQEGKPPYAPHLYFCKPSLGCGESKYKVSTITQSEDHVNSTCYEVLQESDEQKGTDKGHDLGIEVRDGHRVTSGPGSAIPTPIPDPAPRSPTLPRSANGEFFTPRSPPRTGNGDPGGEIQRHVRSVDVPSVDLQTASPESLDSLLGLSGDFNTHYRCLQYGQWFLDVGSSMQAWPVPLPLLPPPPPPPHFFSMNPWDAMQHSSLQNRFPNENVNGLVHGPGFYPPMNSMIVPHASYGFEEMPNPRGTGTYFPNPNRPPRGYRPSAVKGRSKGPARSPSRNGQGSRFTEFPVEQNEGLLGYPDGYHPDPWVNAHGAMVQPNGIVEFPPFFHALPGARFQESRQPRHDSPEIFNPGLPTPGNRSTGADVRSTRPSSYHLKDEDDFPPLSG